MQAYCLNITFECCTNRDCSNGVHLFMWEDCSVQQHYHKLKDIEVMNQEGLVETTIKSKPYYILKMGWLHKQLDV